MLHHYQLYSFALFFISQDVATEDTSPLFSVLGGAGVSSGQILSRLRISDMPRDLNSEFGVWLPVFFGSRSSPPAGRISTTCLGGGGGYEAWYEDHCPLCLRPTCRHGSPLKGLEVGCRVIRHDPLLDLDQWGGGPAAMPCP